MQAHGVPVRPPRGPEEVRSGRDAVDDHLALRRGALPDQVRDGLDVPNDPEDVRAVRHGDEFGPRVDQVGERGRVAAGRVAAGRAAVGGVGFLPNVIGEPPPPHPRAALPRQVQPGRDVGRVVLRRYHDLVSFPHESCVAHLDGEAVEQRRGVGSQYRQRFLSSVFL